jgi:hypothetical protein
LFSVRHNYLLTALSERPTEVRIFMKTLENDHHKSRDKSLETRIGLYGLHKLGVASLVFGIVFLITYSFPYFGVLLKLLSGFIVSLTLIVLGSRMAGRELQRWFGYGLLAGGWSLAYFTTYAAYYLPIVQVVNSLTIETILLMLVAGGCLNSALRARSQMMAIYSVMLATASILMSRPGLLSDISFLIIAVATSILGNRQGWQKLWTFGLLSCYLGHIYCSGQATNLGDNVIASAFLSAIWLVFSVGLAYSVHSSDQARRFTTIASFSNSVALAAGLLFFSGRGIQETSEMLLASAGSVYLSAARWLHNRNEEQLKIVHSCLGLSLINLAKFMHFSGTSLLSIDIAEIAFLGIVGAKYGLKSFRWFAVGLTLLLFPMWMAGAFGDSQIFFGIAGFPYFKLGICAALALCTLAMHHIRNQDAVRLPKEYGQFYYLASNLMIMLTIGRIVDVNWQACALVAQAVVNHLIALRLTDRFYAHPGTLSASIALLYMSSLSSWLTEPTALIVLFLYWAHVSIRVRAYHDESRWAARVQGSNAYGFSRFIADYDQGRLDHFLKTVYACAANIMLTLFLFRQLPSDYVSPALGLEGICFLMAGFTLNDRLFRMSGLLVLALLAGKLLFFDFAKFDTLERVISFTVAGLVFLLSSYGYARFTRSFEDKGSEESLDIPDVSAETKP